MQLSFVKYQGTGNDFILIDGREAIPTLDVRFWCDRRFGIGADGLMILAPSNEADFEMIYYNSDGQLSSMCGNGGRCIAHWAQSLGIGNGTTLRFKAPDGFHEATFTSEGIKLSMNPVRDILKLTNGDTELNTGSPHYVKQTTSIPPTFIAQARTIRQSAPYNQAGINVNFYQVLGQNELRCRTFERGVEDETLSCGTGVTAVALSYAHAEGLAAGLIHVQTEGGALRVHFIHDQEEHRFHSIFLEGPATFVFQGFLNV
jgi:diaminopimelate epimerase